MLKGLLVGIVLGVLLVAAGVYFYFASGRAPVATSAPDMPFEQTFARKALHSYLDKLPHPAPAVQADDATMMAGAMVYTDNCAPCHGLPGQQRTAIAQGMYPKPPQLFHGVGVTDDEPWETYWKVENGIRMTGMPGFKGALSETDIWQVTMLLKNADKISPSVRAQLTPTSAAPADAKGDASGNPARPKN